VTKNHGKLKKNCSQTVYFDWNRGIGQQFWCKKKLRFYYFQNILYKQSIYFAERRVVSTAGTVIKNWKHNLGIHCSIDDHRDDWSQNVLKESYELEKFVMHRPMQKAEVTSATSWTLNCLLIIRRIIAKPAICSRHDSIIFMLFVVFRFSLWVLFISLQCRLYMQP